MAEKLTPQSTKSDLWKAYNELAKKVQEEKTADRRADKKRDEETQIVAHAAELTPEAVVKGIADLKLDISKLFDGIEDTLVAEVKRLHEIQQATEIQKCALEEIHEISRTADTLTTLLRAQQEKRASFETEMTEKREVFDLEMTGKRTAWRKEHEETEAANKERKIRLEKDRKQEEEEYSYNTQKKRKQEDDEYQSRRVALEKELVERRQSFEQEIAPREKAVAEREKELEGLRAQVEAHPREVEKAVAESEKRVRTSIELGYKHQADLLTKEIEGERKLHEQISTALESKIREKDALISQLSAKVDESGKQVQDIAVKAIEGASRPSLIREITEKASDPNKADLRGR